jgi:hypothetical protein
MDDLTESERRLVLAALWRFRGTLGRNFDDATGGDPVHEVETMDTLDTAARKLGGNPADSSLPRSQVNERRNCSGNVAIAAANAFFIVTAP